MFPVHDINRYKFDFVGRALFGQSDAHTGWIWKAFDIKNLHFLISSDSKLLYLLTYLLVDRYICKSRVYFFKVAEFDISIKGSGVSQQDLKAVGRNLVLVMTHATVLGKVQLGRCAGSALHVFFKKGVPFGAMYGGGVPRGKLIVFVDAATVRFDL